VTNDVTLFTQKMQEIRAQALGCEYDIPEPEDGEEEFDPTKLNVKYTPGGMGSAINIPKADNQGDCGSVHGWYYDDNINPSKVYLCPATCAMVQSDATALVELAFGCPTVNN
ncbi:MAG: VWA domain-containing protein, partial [Polyangiaceae bacterium]